MAPALASGWGMSDFGVSGESNFPGSVHIYGGYEVPMILSQVQDAVTGRLR